MKRILLIFVLIGFFSATMAMANSGLIDSSVKEGIRLEAINEHAFFILKVDNNFVEYGDKIELVFGLNHKIKVYNISGKDIYTFTNPNELVVLIAPEDLRYFREKKLRKVKVYTGNKSLVIKTNIKPNHLKIK